MKIAITSAVYYPMTNGIATFAHNLALGLANKGHEVMVICPSFTGKSHQVKRHGVTTVYLKSIRIPFYPDQINKVPDKKEILGKDLPRLAYRYGLWVSPNPYLSVRRALKKFKPDVIHSQTSEMIGQAALTYAERHHVPIVATGHTYPDTVTGQFKLLKPIKRPVDAALVKYMARYLKHSDYATMPTEIAITDLTPKNKRRFKVPIEALSNGVDLSSFKPGKANIKTYLKYRLPTDRPIVLYVGRIDPEKSVSLVLEAFTKLLEDVPEALLVVVGEGTDREHLEDYAKYLGIDKNIKFLGRILPPAITDIYRAGSLFVTASEIETQGIVLIEAAATGLPLVAVDAGAVSEICHDNKNGYLCQPKDVDGIYQGMKKILTDKDRQHKFSQNSLKFAKEHDLNNTIGRFEEIYQTVIDSKNSSS